MLQSASKSEGVVTGKETFVSGKQDRYPLKWYQALREGWYLFSRSTCLPRSIRDGVCTAVMALAIPLQGTIRRAQSGWSMKSEEGI